MTAQRADQLGAPFGRMLDQPVASSGRVQVRDQAGIDVDILARIAAVTNDLVVVPVGRELRDYERYRTELAAARNH